MEMEKKITVYATEEWRREFKATAAKRGLSVSDAMLQAAGAWMGKEPKESQSPIGDQRHSAVLAGLSKSQAENVQAFADLLRHGSDIYKKAVLASLETWKITEQKEVTRASEETTRKSAVNQR